MHRTAAIISNNLIFFSVCASRDHDAHNSQERQSICRLHWNRACTCMLEYMQLIRSPLEVVGTVCLPSDPSQWPCRSSLRATAGGSRTCRSARPAAAPTASRRCPHGHCLSHLHAPLSSQSHSSFRKAALRRRSACLYRICSRPSPRTCRALASPPRVRAAA